MKKSILILVCILAVITLGTWNCSGDGEEQAATEAGFDVTPIIVENLEIGATQQITVANASGETLVYSSGDAKIATVSASGLITAIAVGSTGIGIRNESGSIRQAVNVTVYKPLDEIEASVTKLDLTVRGKDSVKFVFIPEDATYQTVEYSSSNPAVATIVDGVVEAVGLGETVITATSVQPHNVAVKVEIPVRVVVVMDLAVGHWQFEDATNLGKASAGQDLIAYTKEGNGGIGNPSSGDISQVEGPVPGSHAVRIPKSSYYRCYHGMEASGGGANVNEYTFMVDFKIPATNLFYSFLQTNLTNSNDGDLFIRTSGSWGFRGNYTELVLHKPQQWYRMLFSVRLGGPTGYYLDGVLIDTKVDALYLGIDSERVSWPLEYVLLFCDESGDENVFDIAEVAIWNRALTADEVKSLGGAGN